MPTYELDKAYEPSKYEKDIYMRWEKCGAFTPDGNAHLRPAGESTRPYTIIMPPPNANGSLHLGHAMYVVEDIASRYHRMRGDSVLWQPGTDHAGIETQVVFERELAKEGKSRFDLGRDKFYDAALEFTLKNRPNIIGQFKSLGFSADWSKTKFTLDEDIVKVVYSTFKKMHDDGLIYRGNRIVNWCTSCRSSFADIEVKHVDRDDALYVLDYGPVKIATTRPETIFADTAVAVNPKDERFAGLIGQTAIIPLVNRPVPIIADNHVEMNFGTGALKITPAHDKNDYEIGLRHDLPEISIIDLDGKMINIPEEFAGLSVTDARKAVLAALEAAGALVDTKPLNHSVGIHDRCSTVIEPLITEQWYLRIAKLNAPVIKAIEHDHIRIIPSRFKKIALDWLRNEHDWNIGRQNWFGISIPVYYKDSNDPDKAPYLITADEQEAREYYGEGNYRLETDTFDTWFSSGQWPYATLKTNGEIEHRYPTDVMMTARDILTKWVTRMAMFSLYSKKELPFKDVYLWGLVNDEHGRKMSKSKGNVINPLEMTAKYGTDALRLALTIGITPGNDGSLSERKIEGYRNFCNKLWNVARFILGQLPEDYSPALPEAKTPADHWMAAKLSIAIDTVTDAIENYRFSEAGQTIYSLLWDDFADWYIEASKVSPNHDLLVHTLRTILKLAHPIAPFVTEAIWSKLPDECEMLIVSKWPDSNDIRTDTEQSTSFENIRNIVQAARTIANEERLNKPSLQIKTNLTETEIAYFKHLAKLSEVNQVDEGTGFYLGTRISAWIVADEKQVAARKHKLETLLAEKKSYIESLEAKLANSAFTARAPEHIVSEMRDKLAETGELAAKLRKQIGEM